MQSKFSLGREERIIRRVRGASVISIGCHEFFSFFLAANILWRFDSSSSCSPPGIASSLFQRGKRGENYPKISYRSRWRSSSTSSSRGRWLSSQSDQELCRIAGCTSLFLPPLSLSLCLLSFRTATLLCERASTANVPRPLRYFHRVIRRKNLCLRIVFQRTKTKSMGRWTRAFYFPNLNRDIIFFKCVWKGKKRKLRVRRFWNSKFFFKV